ncbi:unnamed protein product [Didymodactylos carnosus]|uniref:Uncharacterized protein n=1 Tax=Didymodactylos carnosus TaxID=1234261 RepID=A0A814VPS6_9BILA|nr:unnamed protein product [Didymodactylos carnosus]CAF1381813.1 unnamed protein product [Didymodactylos carnosus]CAF3955160.1 unnamed protein product [Didymodactylos carnosus]CAF4190270.1 unnamed protein product [Didymodactylos carnosus]
MERRASAHHLGYIQLSFCLLKASHNEEDGHHGDNASTYHTVEDDEKEQTEQLRPAHRNKGQILFKECKIELELIKLKEYWNTKIYGTIQVHPREAQEFVKHFKLYVDNTPRVDINSTYSKFSASGFLPNKKYTIYLEAQPKDEINYEGENKNSNAEVRL